jgi:sugar phosphate isomerase/epimerase
MKRFRAGAAALPILAAVCATISPAFAAEPTPTAQSTAPVVAPATPPDYRTNGFLLGCQAWSFNRYTVMEAIEKTAQTGGKTIELFPGQALSPDSRDVKFGPGASDETIAAVKAQLDKYGIKAVAFGVTGLSADETRSRPTFEFAKKLGVLVINSEPPADAMDTIEKLVKEYDIRVGIHNHPKQPNNPNYRHWDPNFILSLVKNRDKRIGSCADMGHFVRSGIKPTDALRILQGRVVSSHLKDLDVFAPQGHDVPFGTGVSDIRAILAEFRRQKFAGPVSIEYEHNWETSVPEIAQSVGFVRGVALP